MKLTCQSLQYHRAFTPPAWYPKVERVGVSFTLESMINVTGGLYFALTPKCVMGGGALHFGLEVGPVSAWLDIAFDVFVQFKPFFYMADLMVSVGCAISIKVWFIHVRIKASVGAALHIEGPEKFGGVSRLFIFGSPPDTVSEILLIKTANGIERHSRFLPLLVQNQFWGPKRPPAYGLYFRFLRNGAAARPRFSNHATRWRRSNVVSHQIHLGGRIIPTTSSFSASRDGSIWSISR